MQEINMIYMKRELTNFNEKEIINFIKQAQNKDG